MVDGGSNRFACNRATRRTPTHSPEYRHQDPSIPQTCIQRKKSERERERASELVGEYEHRRVSFCFDSLICFLFFFHSFSLFHFVLFRLAGHARTSCWVGRCRITGSACSSAIFNSAVIIIIIVCIFICSTNVRMSFSNWFQLVRFESANRIFSCTCRQSNDGKWTTCFGLRSVKCSHFQLSSLLRNQNKIKHLLSFAFRFTESFQAKYSHLLPGEFVIVELNRAPLPSCVASSGPAIGTPLANMTNSQNAGARTSNLGISLSGDRDRTVYSVFVCGISPNGSLPDQSISSFIDRFPHLEPSLPRIRCCCSRRPHSGGRSIAGGERCATARPMSSERRGYPSTITRSSYSSSASSSSGRTEAYGGSSHHSWSTDRASWSTRSMCFGR